MRFEYLFLFVYKHPETRRNAYQRRTNCRRRCFLSGIFHHLHEERKVVPQDVWETYDQFFSKARHDVEVSADGRCAPSYMHETNGGNNRRFIANERTLVERQECARLSSLRECFTHISVFLLFDTLSAAVARQCWHLLSGPSPLVLVRASVARWHHWQLSSSAVAGG